MTSESGAPLSISLFSHGRDRDLSFTPTPHQSLSALDLSSLDRSLQGLDAELPSSSHQSWQFPASSELALGNWVSDRTGLDPIPPSFFALDSQASLLNTLAAQTEQPLAPSLVSPTELVFIDAGVTDYDRLIASIKPGKAVFLLDSAQDGILQITHILSQYQDVAAVHLFSHGSAGTLQLGNTTLTEQTLWGEYQGAIASWAQALTTTADLVLYGCEVAAGDLGSRFVTDLGHLTGADVAASVDLTGSAALGGNWNLEWNRGAIETALAANVSDLITYDAVLASFTATASADQIRIKAGAALGSLVIQSDNNTFATTILTDITDLTLNSGGGVDTIIIEPLDIIFTGPITITDPDDVVLGNVNLWGNLTVQAGNSIKVPDAVTITSQGDVTLEVINTTELSLESILLNQKQSSATIDIGNATITGRNVTATTEASTAKTANLAKNFVHDARAISLGDVNGDGRLDMIVGNTDAPSQLYLNNGTIDPFKNVTAIDLGGTNQTLAVALGDVNGDRKLDIVLGNFGGASQLLLNNGTANPFSNVTPINFTNSLTTIAVALGDVNGDGRLDVIFGNEQAPSQIFLNSGTANPFSDPALTFGSATDRTTAIALADVNGDGRLDVIQAQAPTPGTNPPAPAPTRLFLNTGTSNPFSGTPQTIGNGTDATGAIALGDVNGDGRIDLVLGNVGQPSRLFVNNGTATPFSDVAQTIATGGDPAKNGNVTSVSLADVNGDSRLDLVLTVLADASVASNPSHQVILNNGTANPLSGTALKLDSDLPGNSWAAAIGDLDGDGKRDVVVVGPAQLPVFYRNNGTADPFKDVVAKTILPETQLATEIDEPFFLQYGTFAATALRSEAIATLTLEAGAAITATNDVTMKSNARSNAQFTKVGGYLGITYASSTPTAKVILKGNGTQGATIQAGNSFEMLAQTNNTLELATYVANVAVLASPLQGALAGELAISYAKAISTSTAEVQKGATVTALNAIIRAQNTNAFENKVTAFGFEASGPAGVGATIALSDFQSNATAVVNGTITSRADTTLDAQSINLKNITGSSASVSAPALGSAGKDFGSAVQKVGGELASATAKFSISTPLKLGQSLNRGGGKISNFFRQAQNKGVKVSIAAGIAIAEGQNTSNALVGEGGIIFANGKVNITAKAEDNPQASASASAGDASLGSVGGGVVVANFANKANAVIGKNASVDAGQTLLVNADATVARKFNLFLFDLALPSRELPSGQTFADDANAEISAAWGNGQVTVDKVKALFLDGILGGLKSQTGDLGKVSTTLAHSGATVKPQGKAGISGSVIVLDIDNAAQAYIDEGAQINQKLTTPTVTQTVQVTANASVTTLNLAGQAGLANAKSSYFGGSKGGDVGIGGSVDVVTHKNSAKAFIADRAKVSAARDVTVAADTFNYLITLAQAGSQSDRVGVDGAVSFAVLDNNSIAYIDDGAIVTAQRDVAVTANDLTLMANGAGGLAVSGTAGIGVSAGINKITSNVLAFIGDGNNTPSVLGSVTANGNLTVKATSDQKIYNVGLAGGVATGYQPPSSETEDAFVAENISNLFSDNFGLQENPIGGKEFGFGLAGHAAVNWVTPTVQAYIKN
ncbi:MAG: DUF4347 domain-containing protein, partial [Synechococcales bacterium]|nr:DUF4347 domain-containing protein [Synechococcales bacterium]